MLIVAGNFTEVLRGLFHLDDERHLRFGPARSCGPVDTPDALSNWCMFDDYIMEGGVRYALRANPHAEGLILEIQLTGTNRDRFVPAFVRDYVRWAGYSCHDGN
jgi:hypothetical protein